jgi:hypothetical protein
MRSGRAAYAAALALAGVVLVGVLHGSSRAQQAPVPSPFPGAGQPPPAPAPTQPAAPAPAPRPSPRSGPSVAALPPDAPPTEADLNGAPVYPSSEFLASFDAGRGQRYYVYGTQTPFADIVGYYRNVLRDGGRQIFEAPAVRQFELGRYDEETMAFPPSVTVKDYSGSTGYLFVRGTTEHRFRTVIQIVPAR